MRRTAASLPFVCVSLSAGRAFGLELTVIRFGVTEMVSPSHGGREDTINPRFRLREDTRAIVMRLWRGITLNVRKG
jgi:hypothetical protein